MRTLLICCIAIASMMAGCDPAPRHKVQSDVSRCVIISSPNVDNGRFSSMIDSIADALSYNGIDPVIVHTSSLSIAQAVADARQKMDSMRRHSAADDIAVVGYGVVGGPAAMMLAGSDESVASLVLMSTLGVSGKEHLYASLAEFTYGLSGSEAEQGRRLRNAIAQQLGLCDGHAVEADSETARQFLDMADPDGQLAQFDPAKALENVVCPVLVIHGQCDGIVDWKPNVMALERILRHKGCEYEILAFPERNEHYSEAASPIPRFVSLSYSPNFIPEYDMSVFREVARRIKNR